MWRRSASFILDKNQTHHETTLGGRGPSSPPSNMPDAKTLIFENPNPTISAYYQTRAEHHGVVTSDWLAQAQAAVGRDPPSDPPGNAARSSAGGGSDGRGFSVIDEFNYWRKRPDLAEAVAAIMALGAVIKSSEATTMMELEIELKKASDSLKVTSDFYFFQILLRS